MTTETGAVVARHRESWFIAAATTTSVAAAVAICSWWVARVLGGRGPLGTAAMYLGTSFDPDSSRFDALNAVPHGQPNAASWVALIAIVIFIGGCVWGRIAYIAWAWEDDLLEPHDGAPHADPH
jgi:hypothetical protein